MLRPLVRLVPALLAVALVATPGVSTGSTTHAGRALDHTRVRVVRPVRATGRAVSGYTVHRESGSLDCGDQSPYSVSAHVDICFPSAAYTPSCWKAVDHTALCLRDVEQKQLVRFRYSGTFAAQRALPRSSRLPQGLRLADGERCWVRVGGAWGQAPGHPSWVGWYSCDHGTLWGSASSRGIDRSQPVWTVHELLADNSVVTRKVRTAAYVGTAS